MPKELAQSFEHTTGGLIAGPYMRATCTLKANENIKRGAILTREADGKYRAVKVKTEVVYAISLISSNETADAEIPVLTQGEVNTKFLSTGAVTDSSKIEDYRLSALDHQIYFRDAK